MTRRIHTLLALAAFLLCLPLKAQQSNTLILQDLKASAGKTLALPIGVDNTDDVVGLDFILQVPAGATLAPATAQVTNRATDHTVNVRSLGDGRYRFLLYSPTNSSLLARTGNVLTVELTLSEGQAEGSTLDFGIADAVIATHGGTNVLTATQVGQLTVEKGPDLAVGSVQTDAKAYAPGQQMQVNFSVSNIGTAATEAGWTEYVSLRDEAGHSLLLSTTTHDGVLAASSSQTRQIVTMLPSILGIDGKAQIEVEVVPFSGAGESQALRQNNKTATAFDLQIAKVLALSVPSSIAENASQPIRATLTRSGSKAQAETVRLTHTPDSRLNIPSEVSFAANQSSVFFSIGVTDNDVLDASGTIQLTASAEGYEAVSRQFEIVDDELPSLSLSTSKDVLQEGDVFTLTVTTERASTSDILVTLVSETRNRFSFPQQVTIPAGKTSVTVSVTAIDDALPSLTLTNAFTAHAAGHNSGSALVVLEDNDVPALSLTLSPSQVSEAAGPVAVTARLKRTGVTSNAITVKLTDDADGGIYYSTRTIDLPAGVEEATFNLGPIDNALVDGDRTVRITAAVYIASCACSAPSESAGVVAAELRILDNDGPNLAMKLSASTIKEGASATLTLSRNTDTSSPLPLQLSTDHDDWLDYTHSVVIPAGESSVSVVITSKSNDAADDSFTALLTAQAEGFNTATTYLMVTDQSLPDARVTIAVEKTEAMVGSKVGVDIIVSNEGNATLPAGVQVRFTTPTEVSYFRTSGAIGVGESETVHTSFTMPLTIGRTQCFATVNDGDAISELTKTNNTSSVVSIRTTAPYKAEVTLPKAVYEPGEAVLISGQLTGTVVSNQAVDTYIILNGGRQSLSATSDEEGRFSVTWTPQTPLYGHFSVGACYPGENLTTGTASFDVPGLRLGSSAAVKCDVPLGETRSGNILLQNLSQLPLTGLEATVLSAPAGADVKLSLPASIDGMKNANLSYSLTGTAVTEANQWEAIRVQVTCAEGVTLNLSLYFYCRAQQPLLQLSTTSITTTMVKDQTREFPLTITNVGKATTSEISLILPDWMGTSTGTTMPPLAQGESATIMLTLTPTDAMPLNTAVRGSFGISYGARDVAVVSYAITPVSESKGRLIVDVKDENTFYTAEAPHVQGAVVTIKSPAGQQVAQQTTNVEGLCEFELPEGPYQLIAEAADHKGKSYNIIVDPGVETRKNITLSIDAIKIDYSVKPTTVEDSYEVVTSVSYKTNVPVPVVVLTGPSGNIGEDMQPGDKKLLTFLLTNNGLITAQNVTLGVPEESDTWRLTPMSSFGPFDIAPQTTVSVMAVLERKDESQATRPLAPSVKASGKEVIRSGAEQFVSTFDRCMMNMAYQYQWQCGDDIEKNEGAILFALTTCAAGATANAIADVITSLQLPVYSLPVGDGINGPGSAPNQISSLSYQAATIITPDHPAVINDKFTFCDPEDTKCAMAIADVLIGYGKSLGAKALKGFISNSRKLKEIKERRQKAEEEGRSQGQADAESLIRTLMAYFQTALEMTKETVSDGTTSISKMTLDMARSFYDAATACEHSYNKLHPRGEDGRGDAIQTIYDYAHLLMNTYEIGKEITGVITGTIDQYKKIAGLSNHKYQQMIDDYEEYLNTVDWGTATPESIMENAPGFTDYLKEKFGDYINSLDWETVTVESLKENAPELIPLLLLRRISERIIETYNEFLYLRDRDFSVRPRRLGDFETDGIVDGEVKYSYIDIDRVIELIEECEALDQKAVDDGYESLEDKFWVVYEAYQEYYSDESEHVCATLQMAFKQTVTLAREAFEGTLTVTNGHVTKPIRDFKVQFLITDEAGKVATTDIMDQQLKSTEGFTGEIASLQSGWTLEAGGKGESVVLFTPSALAAPTAPQKYLFGGTVTYVDPFTDLVVTRELLPVQLQVNPTPQLELTYFLQRDIYGDDPLTEAIEPSAPAEFAVLINNKGYGDAQNVRMQTEQPTIVVNEKGLANDFRIVSSQLNGGSETPTIGGSTLTDFGDIPAHGTSFAQWWFTSALLGYFTDYDVTLKHLSYDNAAMSLVSLAEMPIHELVRSVKAADGTSTAFLCNDDHDTDYAPDAIYRTDGTSESVSRITSATLNRLSSTQYELTVEASGTGWHYGSVTDPTRGLSALKSVTRTADGTEISLRNFWQTDRTLIDGKDWLYDNNLHFADSLLTQTQTYLLTFDPTPAIVLEVTQIDGLPTEGEIATEPVEEVVVTFSKEVDAATFTADDLSLSVQGKAQDASLIKIASADNKQFALDLSAITRDAENGSYTLTVQTSSITDAEGFQGKTGRPATWIVYRGGLVQLLTSVFPLEAGTVERVTEPQLSAPRRAPDATPEGKATYGSSVTLKATPAEGYALSHWSLNGETVSTDETFTTTALADLSVTANFRKRQYSVGIGSEAEGGSITGAHTGIYEYGTLLTLQAEAEDGFRFVGWSVDGVLEETDNTAKEITVSKAVDVEAVFEQLYTPGDVNGDGSINVIDVMAIRSHILGSTPAKFILKAAQLSGKQEITITDVMKLRSMILSK